MDPATQELGQSCFLWSDEAVRQVIVWEHEQALAQMLVQELVQVLADETCFDSVVVLLALMGYS